MSAQQDVTLGIERVIPIQSEHGPIVNPQMIPQMIPGISIPGMQGMMPLPGMIPPGMRMPHALGLAGLENVSHVFVKQKIELLEIMANFETSNQYDIYGPLGYLFHAQELSHCCTRNCCGSSRPFEMEIRDISGEQIFHLHRPCASSSCFCPCCLQKMTVSSPPGRIIGKITQNWSCSPKFSIRNGAGEKVLKIKGPFCTSSCFGREVSFKIFSADGQVEIGRIAKEWSGFVQEAITDADNYGIYFSKEITVQMKAILIGASMLIENVVIG